MVLHFWRELPEEVDAGPHAFLLLHEAPDGSNVQCGLGEGPVDASDSVQGQACQSWGPFTGRRLAIKPPVFTPGLGPGWRRVDGQSRLRNLQGASRDAQPAAIRHHGAD